MISPSAGNRTELKTAPDSAGSGYRRWTNGQMERRKNAKKQILASADTLHPVRYTLYAVHPCKLIAGARLYENLLG